jgi:hypothetical protein
MPHPHSYSSKEYVRFGVDYCISELLSKLGPEVTGSSREDLVRLAMDKFRLAEDQCRDTNSRMAIEFSRLGSAEFDPVVRSVRRKIARVLGVFSWDECFRHFGHGSGATTRLTRRHGDAYYKFRGIPDTTVQCETLSKLAIASVKPWQGAEPCKWSDVAVNRVVGNRITTVPKTAKIDRVIAKEPCMNIYIQRGVGKVIRSRLKRAGIDLSDQTRNQELAREGSVTGKLATLDLSNASDTIARNVVELFLPPEWFSALNQCRSHFGVMTDGSVIRYQKFSTMGNGFTFELESLIFWALCSTVVELCGCEDTRVGVYGDDLIVDSRAYWPLVEQLERFGFTTNIRKSFHDGPFRESCGKHWFAGRDVSPFYIRKGVDNVIDRLLVTNNVRRWMSRLFNLFIPPQAWSVYSDIRDSLVPLRVLETCRIPDGYGDLGVVSSFEEALPQRSPDGWEGWVCRTLAHAPVPERIRVANRVDGPSLIPKSLARYREIDSELLSEREKSRFRLELLTGSPEGDGESSDELPSSSQRLRLRCSKLVVSRWVDVGIPF